MRTTKSLFKASFVVYCTVIFITACTKKDYTCRCDGGFSGQGQVTIIANTYKGKAKKDCVALEQAAGTPDGFTNCRIE